MGIKIFNNLNLEEFDANILARDGPANIPWFYKIKHYREVRIDEVKGAQPGLDCYDVNCIIPIIGVPFCKQSRFQKKMTIDRRNK
jgi:hypothetical protein